MYQPTAEGLPSGFEMVTQSNWNNSQYGERPSLNKQMYTFGGRTQISGSPLHKSIDPSNTYQTSSGYI